jgi:hypothetical protein
MAAPHAAPVDLVERVRGFDRRFRLAARRYGVRQREILAHLLAVYRRTGIRPAEALAIGLGDPALPAEIVDGCIGKDELVALQSRLNPPDLTCLTEDKGVFYPLCEGLGIPIPKTHAVVAERGGWGAESRPFSGRGDWARFLAESLPDELVSKPAEGVYGSGVHVWRRGGRGFIDQHGRDLAPAELYDALCADAHHERFVLQERVYNHPALRRLSGSPALQTVRVTTLVDRTGAVHIVHAFARIVVGDNVIDNFHYGRTGNLTALVTLGAGVLGPAITRAPDGVGIVAAKEHPKTGESIEGFALPWWDEALALARRCARLFLPVRTLGWDVALTPEGPVIIEANRLWDPLDLMPESLVAGEGQPVPGTELRLYKWAISPETTRWLRLCAEMLRRDVAG